MAHTGIVLTPINLQPDSEKAKRRVKSQCESICACVYKQLLGMVKYNLRNLSAASCLLQFVFFFPCGVWGQCLADYELCNSITLLGGRVLVLETCCQNTENLFHVSLEACQGCAHKLVCGQSGEDFPSKDKGMKHLSIRQPAFSILEVVKISWIANIQF